MSVVSKSSFIQVIFFIEENQVCSIELFYLLKENQVYVSFKWKCMFERINISVRLGLNLNLLVLGNYIRVMDNECNCFGIISYKTYCHFYLFSNLGPKGKSHPFW